MKLYYAPQACSLASHIVLRELQLPFDAIRVDNRSKRTADGQDFLTLNPKGYVAALQLDNGEVLTEGPAILQYLADLKPEAGLAAANGSWQRVRLQETLNFITSEVHGIMGWLFNPGLDDSVKEVFRQKLFKRFALLEQTLERQDYLQGGQFGIADAYLFTVLRWTALFAIDLGAWPALAKFQARVEQRPAVREALAVELA
ncbi:MULTISPECIES: glutathione transferase GstA [Pseudomonas]|uniref:Glutathione transferase GstA n=1 Tax=Pseudomonas protegens TaxID=380021 RepID=A0A9Q6N9V7_9PSED|nr:MULTISPECIES: glutathione transferase GstA [Pseudomonas]MBS7561102.1 glutathione transferase GstA [Pseudomonas sp. RC4D1]MCL9654822.1 glutathione transferase GstA [Pseudomonas protegens]MCO7577037.1 glutathione transferase GstA [Pseudomonas protegens]MCO7583412.1 glutathione transferase GstA [Pseudomonas chlororaphis]MCO7600454.1 glutathione transferase GstA [Pseudomonas chlororaphis]